MEEGLPVCYCVPDFHGENCADQYDECQLGPRWVNILQMFLSFLVFYFSLKVVKVHFLFLFQQRGLCPRQFHLRILKICLKGKNILDLLLEAHKESTCRRKPRGNVPPDKAVQLCRNNTKKLLYPPLNCTTPVCLSHIRYNCQPFPCPCPLPELSHSPFIQIIFTLHLPISLVIKRRSNRVYQHGQSPAETPLPL